MQGRLSGPIDDKIQAFPSKTWKEEFNQAQKCDFDLIEWVFDSLENPIMTEEGICEIKRCVKNSKVKINSVCADYFMENLLFGLPKENIKKNVDILISLIKQCSKLDIQIIELPFVDSSSLLTKNNLNEIFVNLKPILCLLEKNNIFLTLETDLAQIQFYNLLEKFNCSHIKANYDIGNSISNGFDPTIEIITLKDYIFNVHIKDRIIHGKTITLGQGDVDFDLFFSTLSKIDYKNDLIIQGAREDLNGSCVDPEKTCSKYLVFVRKYLSKFSNE